MTQNRDHRLCRCVLFVSFVRVTVQCKNVHHDSNVLWVARASRAGLRGKSRAPGECHKRNLKVVSTTSSSKRRSSGSALAHTVTYFVMRYFLSLSFFFFTIIFLADRSLPRQSLLVSSQATFTPSLNTVIVIVSNNDLDPSNPNRAGALLLRTPLNCSQAVATCAALHEMLLPFPTGGTGFTAENITTVLTSDRHGAALALSSSVWIRGNTSCKPLVPCIRPSPQMLLSWLCGVHFGEFILLQRYDGPCKFIKFACSLHQLCSIDTFQRDVIRHNQTDRRLDT